MVLVLLTNYSRGGIPSFSGSEKGEGGGGGKKRERERTLNPTKGVLLRCYSTLQYLRFFIFLFCVM